MDIETQFSAAVFGAARNAELLRAHGWPTTAADQVAGAVADLWEYGRAIGYRDVTLQALADRYVTRDGAPRALGENVCALPHRNKCRSAATAAPSSSTGTRYP